MTDLAPFVYIEPLLPLCYMWLLQVLHRYLFDIGSL
jgi:hypothetical protein